MDLSTVRSGLAADLAGVGLPVVTEPRKAQAPCVLVGPITDVEPAGMCAWECSVPVWVIAPAPGDQKAVDLLGKHLTDVMAATGDAVASLGSYNVGQGDLPAYQLTVSVTAKE